VENAELILHNVSTMKRPDFEDVLKIGKLGFSAVKGFLCTTGVQMGHRWGAVVISRKDGVSSCKGASCCVAF
jgi:hypothetical protein